LQNNPDGTITAQPKYTSGIPPLTLRKVPTMRAEWAAPADWVPFTVGMNTERFAAAEEIPTVQNMFRDGHPFLKEFTVSGGKNFTFPSATQMVVGDADGTQKQNKYDHDTGEQVPINYASLRIIPADGYRIHTSGGVSDGVGLSIMDPHGYDWDEGDFPYTITVNKIVRVSDGMEFIPSGEVEGVGAGDCVTDADCGTGKGCVTGQCVDDDDENECSTSDDCGDGEECTSGECKTTEGKNWLVPLILGGVVLLVVVKS